MNWGDFMIGIIVGYGVCFVLTIIFAWYGLVRFVEWKYRKYKMWLEEK